MAQICKGYLAIQDEGKGKEGKGTYCFKAGKGYLMVLGRKRVPKVGKGYVVVVAPVRQRVPHGQI